MPHFRNGSKRKIVEKGNIDTPNTQIPDHSLSCLGTDTSMKSGGVKQVLFCRSLFFLLSFFLVLSVYPFGILTLFLWTHTFPVSEMIKLNQLKVNISIQFKYFIE